MTGQGRDCKIIVMFKIFFIFISGGSQNIWLIAKITITRICQLIQIEILDTEGYWSLRPSRGINMEGAYNRTSR